MALPRGLVGSMVRSMVEELLRIEDFRALAQAIKDRLRGEHQARPGRDEWTLTDAVYSVAERAVDGAERDRLAAAVLLLLKELAETPEDVRILWEWPAGLFQVARRVAWTDNELAAVGEHVRSLAHAAHKWPVGRESVQGMGSARLEFLRLAQFAKVMDEDVRGLLERSIVFLSHGQRESFVPVRVHNHEFGALLGIFASLGFKNDALKYLLTLKDEPRDRVFRAFVQEFERWEVDGTKLQRALLRQYDSNSPPVEFSQPTIRDQRWAAEAASWIGNPIDDSVRGTIERLRASSATDVPKYTKAPKFAKSSPSTTPSVSP